MSQELKAKGSLIALGVAGALAIWFLYSRRSGSEVRKSPERKQERAETKAETKAEAKVKYPPGSRVSTSFGPGRVESYRSDDQIYTILLDVDDEDTPAARSFVPEEGVWEFRPKYHIGEKVKTPYGTGVIDSYRDSDRIFGVKYEWDDNSEASGFLSKEAIEPYAEHSFHAETVIHTIPVSSHYEPTDSKSSVPSKLSDSADESGVQAWLASQGFEELVRNRFKGYTAARLLAESKKEIIELAGGREGLRLYKLLHGDEPETDIKEVKNVGDKSAQLKATVEPKSTGTDKSVPVKPEGQEAQEEEDEEEEDEEEEEEV